MALYWKRAIVRARRCLFLVIVFAVALLVFGFGPNTQVVMAEKLPQGVNPGDECVICHATAGLGMRFSTGEVVSVYVDPVQWEQSVHGLVLQCTACHADASVYPHQGREIVHPAPRDIGYLTRSYGNCGECHEQQYKEYLGSRHAQAILEGNADSAVCSDCHGDHDIESANADRDGLSVKTAVTSCSACHEEEFQQYQNSVHGKALLENGDPNVPACVDCHGVHEMGDTTLPGFRRWSAYMCASCHADVELMKEYGLSTSIMDTYIADFHGATVRLVTSDSEPLFTGTAPEEAMCYDCHGVHEIRSMIDAKNQASGEGLIEVCRQCHEDAAGDFPAAWLGHRTPAANRFPLVFWIQRIYTIVIGFTIVALVVHIGLDFGKFTAGKIRDDIKRKKAE